MPTHPKTTTEGRHPLVCRWCGSTAPHDRRRCWMTSPEMQAIRLARHKEQAQIMLEVLRKRWGKP